MAEYISKDVAIAILSERSDIAVLTPAQAYFDRAAKMIRLLPPADVAPVRRGRWQRHGKNLGECSERGEIVSVRNNYCPNCGARMDLEVSDGQA